MSRVLLLFITLFTFFIQAKAQLLPLSTASDSAKHYYYLGWKQIMDYADYTKAEQSYRKSIAFDPEFILGQSLVGRISPDIKERYEILEKINTKKHLATEDEQLVADVSVMLIEFLNAREEMDSAKTAEKIAIALQTGLKNFGLIGQKYPEEVYFISEYFEIVNYLYGPKKALDTLKSYNLSLKKPAPFLIGYESTLEAALGNYDNALELAFKLKKCFKDKKVPKPYVVLGDIYLQKGDLESAYKYINKALELDPANRAVQRLKKRAEVLQENNF
ncbi:MULTISPECIES: tetratricopeptide repeat protein [unclassified Imperialibacter]|uniref:tetratricopeptide repeat protein n=1 Tax=unclassified Imperialibacter TaxID=2629706 RepID=UPI00186A3F66|nr:MULTISPECIES: tetratricopeptide repeat protein [unclassified Imperialibacter]